MKISITLVGYIAFQECIVITVIEVTIIGRLPVCKIRKHCCGMAQKNCFLRKISGPWDLLNIYALDS